MQLSALQILIDKEENEDEKRKISKQFKMLRCGSDANVWLGRQPFQHV
jgi:hypothetical protein